MEAQPYVLVPRSPSAIVEDQLIRLFKRCVQCPDVNPVCDCPSGGGCSLNSQTCNSCAFTTCSSPQSTAPPAGTIAGAVVGGIIVLAIIITAAWWFRRKRHANDVPEEEYYEPEDWDEMQQQQQQQQQYEKDDSNRYSSRTADRRSTHTVASTTSTIGRQSNIIQIAYIPGVTNRSQSTPDLIPPVPPIPAASGGSSRASQADGLLFLPGDLRQSTYSGYSNRDSVATSRNSVASDVYRNDAVVNPMPAQAVNLLKPTAVSVKSSFKNSPNLSRASSPPPGSPSSSHPPLNTKSSIVGKFAQPRSVTITRKNSHSLKPHGSAAFELDGSDRSISSMGTSYNHTSSHPGSPKASTFEYASSDDESGPSTRLAELPATKTPTSIIPQYNRPVELNGSSASSLHKRQSSIPRAIQDSMMRAMQTNMSKPASESSPFSDEHESRTP